MFNFSKKNKKENTRGIDWKSLDTAATLEEIKQQSNDQTIMLFKHSTRCSISASALDRLERSWDNQEMEGIQPYFLDLIRYREVSNQVAQEFGVAHQSPQLILIRDGKAVYDNSHFGINYQELKEFLG